MIERRILVSYRVDPALAARLVPPPFRPAVRAGAAVAGICLIRLRELRPRHAPAPLGVASENIAHRYAVEWDGPDGVERGVYVPRRDTSARLAALAGGRLFPGHLHHGTFTVDERGDRVALTYDSDDGVVRVAVRGDVATTLPGSSVFPTLTDASDFFRRDSIGWSPCGDGATHESVELQTTTWNAAPLALESVRSSYFDDTRRFPSGSIELDSALVMRSIPADWVARPALVP